MLLLSADGLPVSKTAWRVGVSAIRDVITVSSNRPMHTMPSNPEDIYTLAQSLEAGGVSATVSALLVWAWESLESLRYLLEIDAHVVELNGEVGGWPRRIVEVAHARWGLVSAVTAVDQCAAAAGRAYCPPLSNGREDDIASLLRPKRAEHLPADLHGWALESRLTMAKVVRFRDALVHRRLGRHFGPPRVSVADLEWLEAYRVDALLGLALERSGSCVRAMIALAKAGRLRT